MAKISVDLNYPKGPVERNVFGHFTEHAFGNIYGGMYDPESKFADKSGLRTDVLELMKQVNVPLLRYPGGNFVSNYHWEEGIGPKENRRRMFEYAWLTEESNQFGTADFIELCRKVGAEPLICVNMGSGTAEEAMHWVEYCNGTGDTYYANLRRQHGYEEPFQVKYWGIGNEMYGNWQMENLNAEDYAKKAFQFAKAIKWADPSVKLIACGMQEDADWNYTCMKAIGSMCDYISAHHYAIGWGPFERHNYLQSMYVADYMEMLNTLTVSAIHTGMNEVTGHCKVAWDEWNMFGWVFDGVNDDKSYTLQDSIVTALILNMFVRNSDTIGMANYSTFVNINGAVSVHGDRLVKRSQFHTFDLLGNSVGDEVLDVKMSCPTMTVPLPVNPKLGRPPLGIDLVNPDAVSAHTRDVPVIDCTATRGADGTVYLSLVNKSPEENIELTVSLPGLNLAAKEISAKTIYHDDINAANTLESPDEVTITQADAPSVSDDSMTVTLKKHSVNMIVIR